MRSNVITYLLFLFLGVLSVSARHLVQRSNEEHILQFLRRELRAVSPKETDPHEHLYEQGYYSALGHKPRPLPAPPADPPRKRVSLWPAPATEPQEQEPLQNFAPGIVDRRKKPAGHRKFRSRGINEDDLNLFFDRDLLWADFEDFEDFDY